MTGWFPLVEALRELRAEKNAQIGRLSSDLTELRRRVRGDQTPLKSLANGFCTKLGIFAKHRFRGFPHDDLTTHDVAVYACSVNMG